MAEPGIEFASVVGAGIAAGIFTAIITFWFERRRMKLSMMSALDVETKRNCQIAQSNAMFEANHAKIGEKESENVIFVPFHCDVWKSIINHGLLNAFDKEVVKDLVETYSLIHEVNSVISVQGSRDQVSSPFVSGESANALSETRLCDLVFSGSRRLISKIVDLRRELGFKEKADEQ